MTGRAAGAALALVVAAWFGLLVVQARAVSDAVDVIFDGDRTTAQVEHSRDRLDVAGAMRPGQDVALLRAQLDLLAGRAEQGLRAAEAVATAEPDQLAAWRLIAALAQRGDPPLAARARAEMRRLNPPVPAG